jgi:hypothetical protein
MAAQIRHGLRADEERRAAYRDFKTKLATLTEDVLNRSRPRQSVTLIMVPAA